MLTRALVLLSVSFFALPLLAQGSQPAAAAEAKAAAAEAKAAVAEAKASETDPANLPPRRAAWILGGDVRQLSIKPDNSLYDVDALAPDINGGYAWIQDRSWFLGRVHLALGPTSQRFPDSPPLDFSGYGISLMAGTTLSSSKLRQKGGDYGAEIGFESFELVGRSFRRQVLGDGSQTNAWVLKVRWIGITGGVFATFLKPSRPAGSRPEWLMTRIEGYRLGLGLVAPLENSWDLRYERNSASEGDRGTWKGLLALFSLSVLLGV